MQVRQKRPGGLVSQKRGPGSGLTRVVDECGRLGELRTRFEHRDVECAASEY